ncbi:MAG: MBL fold metallo-hydrolase [Vicinamibacterales bacterium]
MRRSVVLGTLLLVGLVVMSVAAQQAPPAGAVMPSVDRVKDNLYVIAGSAPGDPKTFSGGNVAVFVTPNGVVLVDTKLAGWGQPLLDAIGRITDKPVTTIINTHTHGDHTGNNSLFGATVESIAHENTKANMAKMDAFKGDRAQFLPKKTYRDRMSIGEGASRVDLYHFGPGHTNGDTFIVFPALRVAHAGDMFPWKDAPFIDRGNGGSGVEWPNTLGKALATLRNVDTVIPGHHPAVPRSELEEFQRFTADLVAAVRDQLKEGKTTDDAAASINLSAKYPAYKSVRLKAAVEALYDEINQ